MSGLFDNQREANLSSAVLLVEQVLVELGHRAADVRITSPGTTHAWHIARGSASVEIALLDRVDAFHLRVAAVVLVLDGGVDRAALFERLLSLNASRLIGDAFALRGDAVVLLGQRSSIDLDRSEVRALIDGVLSDADEHDDVLIREFGGRPA